MQILAYVAGVMALIGIMKFIGYWNAKRSKLVTPENMLNQFYIKKLRSQAQLFAVLGGFFLLLSFIPMP